MAIAAFSPFLGSFVEDLDNILTEVCERLQLTPARYDLAVERYNALNRVLESSESPFRLLKPEIYPQGSMELGTTVRPLSGDPHDLDLVLQLSVEYQRVDPLRLLQSLYSFMKQNGTYSSMTFLKKRCVRIEYADEFYLDILPACLNSAAGGTCIRVPDRELGGWTDSNPLGYAKWFKQRSVTASIGLVVDRAAPVPSQQAVAEKSRLQLAVQLSKRWRDIHYADVDQKLAPISIVLTTLAAEFYRGESSVSEALLSILNGVVGAIDASRRAGEKHLRIVNPSNRAEDLSEKWDENPAAYEAFVQGVRDFQTRWSRLMGQGANVDDELLKLFGAPVTDTLRKRATQMRKMHQEGALGVTSLGTIVPAASAAIKARPNTFYGQE
jgi:hypothetical protein